MPYGGGCTAVWWESVAERKQSRRIFTFKMNGILANRFTTKRVRLLSEICRICVGFGDKPLKRCWPPRSVLPSIRCCRVKTRKETSVIERSVPSCSSRVVEMTPAPRPLIRTVTGEVRPPSTHRQPLVQSQ
ncbi:hypothetical protein F2P81_018389 [Scophthalmus maximus]|uniref:Uncharacterized protein n=1 Tax=Scophthalmus maximus TaxID=52904 RepID=A0A6A4SEG9_SCOMX|nr:hypothetical protein F2P81_018389 [Scophthalmus maximus]